MFFREIKSFMYSFQCILSQEKHSIHHFIPVFIGIGICSYFYLDKEPSFYLNVIICALLLIYSFFSKYKKIAIGIFLISFGACLAQFRTIMINTPMLIEKTRPIKFVAIVDSCEKTPNGMRFLVSDIDKFRLNKAILNWRTKKIKNYTPGDRVLFNARLYPLNGQAFPLAYDFKRQQYFKGIGARGFISSTPVILQEKATNSMSIYVEKFRHAINKQIEDVLSQDISAITKALITGEKSAISQDIRDKFANSGTAHLLAISGLHMGIIGFFIFGLFRLILCLIPVIARYYDVKKVSAIISLIFVTFYLYISGCSVPSVRAFIMHTLILIAILCNRVALTMRSIAIAGTIIMIFSPEVITFPGFQMSFSAVIAIVALYEHRHNLGKGKFVLGIIMTTVAASIPTSLFSMFSFNQLTLNSILANVICIPLMSFIIMPLAVIVLFLMPFNLHFYIVKTMGYFVNILVQIVSYSSTLPGSHFAMYTPTPITMCIFIFSGLILTLIHHKVRYLGVIGVIFGMISYYNQSIPDIFIAPYGKFVGFRTDKCACFNTLQAFRSMSTAWMKSIGLDDKANFRNDYCKKYVDVIDNNYYRIDLNNQTVTVADDIDADVYIDEQSPYAKVIYLPSLKKETTEGRNRPWS